MPQPSTYDETARRKVGCLNWDLSPIDQSPAHRAGQDLRLAVAVQVHGQWRGHRRQWPGDRGIGHESQCCTAARTAIERDAAFLAAHDEIERAVTVHVDKGGPASAPCSNVTQALGDEGAYQLRGGPNDPTGDVLSFDGKSGIKAGGPWATWLGARALFLGSSISSFTVEVSGGSAYDWSMVHTGVSELVPAATVALCADNAPANVTGAQLRLQHQVFVPDVGGGNIIPTADGTFLPGCDTEPTAPSACD